MTVSKSQPIDEILSHCIHCGMCLPVCPTYALTYKEQSSPRGRIRLIRSVLDGKLDPGGEFGYEMNFCLDCQACQTACPAGVQYGSLVEDARRLIYEQKKEPLRLRLVKWIVLRGVLRSKWRTKLAARLLKLYRTTGLLDAVQQSGFLKNSSGALRDKHSMLPRVPDKFFDETVQELLSPAGSSRGRVALLTGCVMNVVFPEIHRDVVDVLLRNGFEVVIPKGQGCCGSLHGHNGDVRTARALARRIIDAFDGRQLDAIIVDSAGCSAFLKEYGSLLRDERHYALRAENLSKRTKDITEFLAEVGYVEPRHPVAKRVTYHEACHLVHTQAISRQPRRIVASIPGIELVELPEATWCCGSAGIYNIVHFEDSMALLERKMSHIASTKAEIVLTGNPGCHLQIDYGIRKFGLKAEVMHPVSLLRRAYEGA